MIGHTDSKEYSSYGQRERCWWTGKPWRRVELMAVGDPDKGEVAEWMLTLNLAIVRLGLHFHTTLGWRCYYDYSEEEHQ